jgi:hypothetical protein
LFQPASASDAAAGGIISFPSACANGLCSTPNDERHPFF